MKNYRVSNRRYRNRRIGDFLKELHLTEGRNTGFKKILNAFETNGSPKPEFETDDDHSYFISRLFVHEGFLKEEPEGSRKRAEKEPKRSRKKTDNFKNFKREFYNDTDSAYGGNEFNKKTSTKRHERIAGGRCTCKRGH